jgi:hypothetical protein
VHDRDTLVDDRPAGLTLLYDVAKEIQKEEEKKQAELEAADPKKKDAKK